MPQWVAGDAHHRALGWPQARRGRPARRTVAAGGDQLCLTLDNRAGGRNLAADELPFDDLADSGRERPLVAVASGPSSGRGPAWADLARPALEHRPAAITAATAAPQF